MLKQSDPLFDMSLQNAKNPPTVWFVTVEIPVGVAWSMTPEASGLLTTLKKVQGVSGHQKRVHQSPG